MIVVADVGITAALTSNKTAMTESNSNVIPRADRGIEQTFSAKQHKTLVYQVDADYKKHQSCSSFYPDSICSLGNES